MEIEKNPQISIITVVYRELEATLDFMKSLKAQSFSDYELILVDNDPKEDHSVSYLNIIPDTQIIRTDKNLGFAGGNNVGIKAAKGEFLFFLNNDTIVTPGFFEALLRELRSKRYDAVSPIIHYYEPPLGIQFRGCTKIDLFGRNSESSSNKTAYLHGAAMALSRSMVDQIGLMPEQYFLYYEEIDWSEKMVAKGFKVGLCTNAMIYHKASVSTGNQSPFKTYYINRNRLWFMHENRAFPTALFFTMYWLCVAMPWKLFRHLLKKEIKQFQALVHATKDGIRYSKASRDFQKSLKSQ